MDYVYEENEQQSYALAFIYPLLQPPVSPKVLDNLKIHRVLVQHINDDDHDCIKNIRTAILLSL